MSVTISKTISNARLCSGITAAREARNASLPDDAGTYPSDPDGSCATDALYVDFVLSKAFESYAVQHVD